MFFLMPIYHVQVKCSRLLAHSDPKKGLLGHGCKDYLWLSALRVWALCKLLQTCWRGWCPRCWFPPGMTSHRPQSRGILECVNWSCRPAAVSLPPGTVLGRKRQKSSDGATPRNWDEISSKSNIKDRSSRVSRTFLYLSASLLSPISIQKHFSSLNVVRLFLSLQMYCCFSATATSSSRLLGSQQLRAMLLRCSESKLKRPLPQRPSSLKTEGHKVHACGQFLYPDNHAFLHSWSQAWGLHAQWTLLHWRRGSLPLRK